MEKHYDPQAVEAKWYPWWESRGLFHSTAEQGGEPYCVVIPPPNVTGILHMGHALNNTIQDILVRWRRMQGRNTVWMPGTDHAGIATQNVVEKDLHTEGHTRESLGREKFLDRVWAWREEYGRVIVNQLRKLGSSCDWERERFTMDEGMSAAVTEVFCRLYDEGLIYRGNYIVNWCPRCRTALSDEESEHVETAGNLWHLRYPVKGGGELVLATTRPETMLGDTAVAVNPSDERYRKIIGGTVVLPLLGREIPVVADDYVDPGFGTGVVKITPAHDPNDFMVAERHGLPSCNVMDEDGIMNSEAGPYAGLDRFEARRRVVADLESAGLLAKIEDHVHAVGHCYRCDTVVEPRLSSQWFVRMKPLAEPAIEAVRSGEVRFTPVRWKKTYFEWMENIRDWCISRQIWWGHRIPVYTCDCGHEWAARTEPQECPQCRARNDAIAQEEDVLDTWFSSWLWPFSTFGWPAESPDLKFYYPTHDLATAPDIIFFWVARMVMAGCKFMGQPPFSNVYIHGTVRDSQGRKMSKSLGNSLDPLEIIEEFSADSLRFSLMMITSTGMDVYVDKSKFEIGRNFGTKIWNAARFIKMHGAETSLNWRSLARDISTLSAGLLTDDDRHLLTTLDEIRSTVTTNLEEFRFQDAARAIYDFVWSDLCDWYLEYSKTDLYGDNPERRAHTLTLLTYALSSSLRLLHPFMPFLTEELWHAMEYGGDEESIMTAPWPETFSSLLKDSWQLTEETRQFVESKRAMITAGRALRADYNIPPATRANFILQIRNEEFAGRLRGDEAALKAFLKAETVDIRTDGKELPLPGALGTLGTIYLPLEGLVDVEAESRRIADELEKARKFLHGVESKLGNANFVSKAPASVVEQQKVRKTELTETIERLERLARTLAGD